MAAQLLDSEIAELKKTFDVADKDGNGTISAEEMAMLMRSLGLVLTESEIYDIIDDVDSDGDREINFNEFLTAMAPKLQNIESDENLKAAFDVFDRDADGVFTSMDLRSIITTVGEVASDEDVNDLIREMDLKGNGKIDYQEFINYIRSST